jgi:flagellar biosynthesis GTPase FlhF
MKMNKQVLGVAVVLATAIAGYMGWASLRAQRDLVTLDVRNMDVREVVKKIEHQTWEDIYVDKAVTGRVTLRVRGVPLDEVLRMVGDQTSSRSQVLYPLYSGRASFKNMERSLRGEVDPATHGWTNLAPNPGRGDGGPMLGGFGRGGFGGGPGPFGAMPDTGNQLISLSIYGKDIPFAVAAFGRFAQARVVPEDGVNSTVSVSVNKVPVAKAVSELARKADRKWTKVYVLRGGFGGPGRMQLALRDGERPGRDRGGMAELTEEQRAKMRQEREERQQELNQALPAEERQKLEQAEAERQQQMQALANLTPEQRREQMAQMFGANRQMDRNVRQRVLNSTPEQRAEMNRRQRERRQRGDQFQRGPGGPR